MRGVFRNLFSVVVGGSLLLGCLGWVNYLLSKRLVGLQSAELAISDAQRDMVDVSRPLVLESGGSLTKSATLELLRDVGMYNSEIARLPNEHPLLLGLPWIQRANPYPPTLGEYNPGYTFNSGHFSYGYLGVDSRYHQLTYYYGESDTTPSLLVRKAPGDDTNDGDYYVLYIFIFSRDIFGSEPSDPYGPRSQEDIRPKLDYAAWSTYRGGGSDAREEVAFTAAMTLLETVIVGVVLARWRRRPRPQLADR